MKNIENIHNIEEKEDYTSKIELSFFRHGEKEDNKSKSDLDIELTEAGKKQAVEKSDTKDIDQSLAFGSPRIRAQETAAFVMSGGEDNVTGEESLEELKEKLGEVLSVGTRVGIDKRLDFNVDFGSEYGKIALEYFKKGEYLKFLVEQSDRLAEETRDEGFTYLRGASNIASIIDKYIRVAKRWDELAQDKQKGYSDTLERFFGTHLGVNESFLAKIIEETKGIEERDKFVLTLDNQGFDFTEGFNVEILNKSSDEPVVRISYNKETREGNEKETIFEFNEEVSVNLIRSIIDEGK